MYARGSGVILNISSLSAHQVQFYCLFYRLTVIRCFADHPPAASGLEEGPRTAPHQPMVVRDQNALFFMFDLLREVSSRVRLCRHC
jgi:hypothetical protein